MNGFIPTNEQSRAIQNASNLTNANVPTAVAGPAGSGKTLVATEIAARFASQTSMDLSGQGKRQDVYFVTYTNALKAFVETQLKTALGPDQGGIR